MKRLLQSGWLICLLGSVLYLVTTLLLFSPGQLAGAGHPASPGRIQNHNNEVSWRFRNPEIDQWVVELRQQKELLALKEQQLLELEKRLEAERVELTSVTQAVSQLQKEFDRDLIRFTAQEQENVKRQARLIGSLAPESAAGLLNEMADDDAVRLLHSMKNDQVTLLIETMSQSGPAGTKRAAILTERLSRVLPPSAGNSRTPTSR